MSMVKFHFWIELIAPVSSQFYLFGEGYSFLLFIFSIFSASASLDLGLRSRGETFRRSAIFCAPTPEWVLLCSATDHHLPPPAQSQFDRGLQPWPTLLPLSHTAYSTTSPGLPRQEPSGPKGYDLLPGIIYHFLEGGREGEKEERKRHRAGRAD